MAIWKSCAPAPAAGSPSDPPKKPLCLQAFAKAWQRGRALGGGRLARKGNLAGTPLEGEEWISGPWAVLYALNRYIDTLQQIDRTGAPGFPQRVCANGPADNSSPTSSRLALRKVLFNGIRAEVWMEPDVRRASLRKRSVFGTAALIATPRVALVLGAGNISSIAPLDVFYKLVADGTFAF